MGNHTRIESLHLNPGFPDLDVVFLGGLINGTEKGYCAVHLRCERVEDSIRFSYGVNNYRRVRIFDYGLGIVDSSGVRMDFVSQHIGVAQRKLLNEINENGKNSLSALAIYNAPLYIASMPDKEGISTICPAAGFEIASKFYRLLLILKANSLKRGGQKEFRGSAFNLDYFLSKAKGRPLDETLKLQAELGESLESMVSDLLRKQVFKSD